jgi:23S rRNA (guanosine2251-2'-O)-methyltransferase
MSLVLRNPHSVLAVLKTRPSDLIQLSIPSQTSNDAWEKVAQMARSRGLNVVQSSQRSVKGAKGPSSAESQRFGLAEAVIKERAPLALEELFASSRQGDQNRNGLWLALDSLQDPHNLGAIFRSAAFFGVKGILLTQERSAPLTAAAYDVASGGMEYVPFSVQVNLQRSFEVAKKAGLWVLGSSEHAHDDLAAIPKDRQWLLVLGNEEKGLRRLTQENCDLLCKIPSQGEVGSLNVSVAAGIMIARLSE